MTQNIITYYIPQNLNITKGKIYNLYINKIKNLDLSSIIEKKPIINNKKEEKTITISESDYNNLITLATNTTKLYNQSNEIIRKLINERKK